MVEANTRQVIKAELLAMADEYMAGWDSYETALDEPNKNYTAKTFKGADGIATVVIKYRCDGLTEEQWGKWAADPTVVAVACNSRLTRIELPDDEGHKVRLLKMKMPLVISNRSTLTTFYEHEKEDGTRIIMHSSRGNEALVAAN